MGNIISRLRGLLSCSGEDDMDLNAVAEVFIAFVRQRQRVGPPPPRPPRRDRPQRRTLKYVEKGEPSAKTTNIDNVKRSDAVVGKRPAPDEFDVTRLTQHARVLLTKQTSTLTTEDYDVALDMCRYIRAVEDTLGSSGSYINHRVGDAPRRR